MKCQHLERVKFLKLLSICLVATSLTACAGLNQQYQCGKYKVEQRSSDVIAITDPNGKVDVLHGGITVYDVSSGDIRRLYTSYGYMYLDVTKKDKSHERSLSLSGVGDNKCTEIVK